MAIKTGSEGTSYCDQCEKYARENERLRKALKQILDYGRALRPGPVHHVTFNACAIAEEALSKKRR